jgi:hypothetical protein
VPGCKQVPGCKLKTHRDNRGNDRAQKRPGHFQEVTGAMLFMGLGLLTGTRYSAVEVFGVRADA